MTDPSTSPDVARSEFMTRRVAAHREAEAAEARAMSVARRDFGLIAPAGEWANVGWWSLRLGETETALDGFARSIDWYLRWNDFLATAGPPFRLRAADWWIVFERAILVGGDAERTALDRPIDLDDRSLTPYGRAWAAGLVALLHGDDAAARAEAGRLDDVPVKTLVRHQADPGLGLTLRGLIERDAAVLSTGLDTILTAHLASATRGFRRRSEIALVSMPATVAAHLARRRDLEPVIDERFRRATLTLPRTGDPDLPVGSAGFFDTEYDLVPRALVEQ